MTTQLETIVLEENRLIQFPTGLIGLEEWRDFFLIPHPAGEPFHLLQAVDDERVSLIVMSPWQLIADYQITLAKADAQALGNPDGPYTLPLNNPDTEAYCILSVQAEPFNVTANLLGPLVINWQTGLGQQVVLSDSNYNPRYPVAGQSAAQSEAKA